MAKAHIVLKMITWPNSLKCAFYQFSKPMSRKKIFSTTFLIFDSNYKNEFRLRRACASFPNENDFHFAFHFQNQIHLEKVLAASENL
jgi:hypothetical protein